MHKLNEQYLLANAIVFAVVLSIITIVTTALPISDIQAILNNKVGNNNSTSDNKNVLYESKVGNIIYQRVVNVMGNPQIEVSSMEHGKLSSIGNVTNIQTWIDTYRTSNIVYGEGKGVIFSENGQMAPWIGFDIGQIQNNGTAIYKGIMIFNNNATGNMNFLNNQVGLEIATVKGNNHTSKILKL